MTPVIDAHLHLFARASAQYRRGVHPLYPPDREALADEFIQVMDVHRVDRAISVSLDQFDDYTLYACRTYPDRFSAVSVIDLEAPDPVSDFLTKNEDLPLVGFRIWELGDLSETRVRDLRYFPLLERMAQENVAAWYYSSIEQLALLPAVLAEIPDLTVVLNHQGFCQTGFVPDEYGRPRMDTAIPPESMPIIEALAADPRVHVHFAGQYAFSRSPYPFDDLKNHSQRLLEIFGPKRLMWASDWPWMKEVPGYGACLDLVDLHFPGLSPADRADVFGGNAARVLGIPVKPSEGVL